MRKAWILWIVLTGPILGIAEQKWQKLVPYESERWGFCTAIPYGWDVKERFDGEVIAATSPSSGRELEITISAFHNRDGEGSPLRSLQEIAEDSEDNLRDSMATRVELRNSPTRVGGAPALITYQKYRRSNREFLAKEVRIRRKDEVIIELILRGPVTQFSATEAVFDKIIRSTRPACTNIGK